MLRSLHYRFDNVMARGTPALIGLLAAACCLFTLLNGALLLLLAPEALHHRSVGSSLWSGFLRVLSPTHLARDRGPAPFLASAVVMAFGGILLMSTLIPVISAGLQNQLARLRQGRSPVVETGHVVLLGWSSQVHVIVAELVEANRSRRRACVVVLAEKDRTEMETEIRERAGDLASTRVVCRTGDPADVLDLALVCPERARSVIVVAPEEDRPDFAVIKSLLAVSRTRRGDGPGPSIVAGIKDKENLPAARLAGGANCRLVSVQGFIARLLVQTSLHTGLSSVYTELLEFAGDEIYIRPQPELVGRTFADAQLAYRTSSAIGLLEGDGRIVLNPPGGTRIGAAHQIVVISEDDSTVETAQAPALPASAPLRTPAGAVRRGRAVLILGSNQRLPDVVGQLRAHLPVGSRIDVVADRGRDLSPAHEDGGLPYAAEALGLGHSDAADDTDDPTTVSFRRADVTRRDVLEALGLESYDHVLVISPDDCDPHRADARTLTVLLNLRDLSELHTHTYSVVTEMAYDRHRALAQAAKPDDFVVSGNLLSLRLAQVSENPRVDVIFEELFSPEGCRIALQAAGDYVPLGEVTDFYAVVDAARRRGETAIGHRIHARAHLAPRYGNILNPDKTERVSYEDLDRIIVLTG
ncbi:CASTOR/POLLUX-related putative ion channel [Streptomyces candidus]|uniref:Voltage-gated potassium channel Kch n=1 Tax=Streptomyces candidus TaxID=67283 RepID=A0A7X0HDY9_9ACTN|nr:potassium transporter TrkA [Streptomyces candidus]MBB6435864.1 voltage-gated potassium channel Kch [Streptomyces candidus]GHH42758.1 lipoprotein [Streptomyces candidus]